MGGNSAERDVSLASGAGVVASLRKAGYDVTGIDTALGTGQLSNEHAETARIDENPPDTINLAAIDSEATIRTVSSPDLKNVDLVFIALHGGIGENGTIQALLDMVGIPYTGSGVLASAAAMDKIVAKKIMIASGIPTPDYFVRSSDEITDEKALIDEALNTIGFPLVVKPHDQGSSVGLDISKSPDDLFEKAKTAAGYSHKVLFEKFIPGRELTVGILGNEPLPVAEVRPKGGFYDYHHKYTSGMTEYLVPAPLTEEETKIVSALALSAFKALGCRGYARIDFRYSPDSQWYFLEANTLPGMTQTSLVPKAAKSAGMEFHQLLDRIAQIAIEDFEKRKNV